MKSSVSLFSKFLLATAFVFTLAVFYSEGKSETQNDIYQTAENNPQELGVIHWQRDLDAAYQASNKTGKPVFLLFQEVPGCITCRTFGDKVLSHPLMVEAIQNEFIPVLIYNNKSGGDSKLLKSFREPSWNNPVVRYLNAQGNDLIPRRGEIWSVEGIASRMIASLKAANRDVPKYLQSIAPASLSKGVSLYGSKSKLEKATFAMYCYWQGQAKLGSLDGVIEARAGHSHHQEVVELIYDPSSIQYETLVKKAQEMECATNVYAHTDEQFQVAQKLVGNRARKLTMTFKNASWSDNFYALKRTSLRYLPLTPMQATKINGVLGLRKPSAEAVKWLSPGQYKNFNRIAQLLREDKAAFKGYEQDYSTDSLKSASIKIQKRLEEIKASS